jgi:RNA recognition motif-containing protein
MSTEYSEPQPGKRVIIRNLPVGTTREELRELGDKFGRVILVELISKPEYLPFGFITFLSQDDAAFTIYRLHGYRYKNSTLDVNFAKSEKKPQKSNLAPKPKDKKRIKKQMYSLRTLTPINPPTPSQQQPPKPNDSQAFKSWQDHTPVHSPTGSSGDQPEENGYIPPPEKQVYEQTTNPGGKAKPRNNNNNNNNRRGGKSNFKKSDPHMNPQELEAPTTDTAPPAVEVYAEINESGEEPLQVTDIEISIQATQSYWTFKVGPGQLQEFLKAVNPFLQANELQKPLY